MSILHVFASGVDTISLLATILSLLTLPHIFWTFTVYIILLKSSCYFPFFFNITYLLVTLSV